MIRVCFRPGLGLLDDEFALKSIVYRSANANSLIFFFRPYVRNPERYRVTIGMHDLKNNEPDQV